MHVDLFRSRMLLVSLVLLLFNDFYLKTSWPGVISGKLSDFAGISLFSLFLFALFPRARKLSMVFVIGFFCWWKSEWSTSFIYMLNRAGLPDVNRTIDYTDLFALIIVPACYYYARSYNKVANYSISQCVYYTIVVPASLFAITATSQIPGHYKSEFHSENNSANMISERQAIVVVDRVLQYYNHSCVKYCDETSVRHYQSSRGFIEYKYNRKTHQIELKHVVNPNQSLHPLPKRNDVKFLVKIRSKIENGLKDVDSRVKIKVRVKPGYYPSY